MLMKAAAVTNGKTDEQLLADFQMSYEAFRKELDRRRLARLEGKFVSSPMYRKYEQHLGIVYLELTDALRRIQVARGMLDEFSLVNSELNAFSKVLQRDFDRYNNIVNANGQMNVKGLLVSVDNLFTTFTKVIEDFTLINQEDFKL